MHSAVGLWPRSPIAMPAETDILQPGPAGDDAPELFKESLKVGKMVAKAEIMKEERLKSEVHQQVIKHSLTAEALELRKQRIKNNTDSIKMASARLATAKAHDDKKLQIIDNLMNHDIGL